MSTYGNEPHDPNGPPPQNPGPPPGGEIPSPPPAYGQPSYGMPSEGQPAYGQPDYGQAPPPPPPGGYGGQGGGGGGGGDHSGPYSAPTAIGYGWKKFTENIGIFLLLTFVMFAVSIAISVVVGLLTGGLSAATTDDSGLAAFTGGFSPSSLVTNALTSLVTVIFWAALVKAALDVVSGVKPTLGSAFSDIDWVQVLIASLIISVLTTIGTALCVLPGIIVGFLTMFTLFFIIDKKRQSIDGLKDSFTLVTQNIGSVILFILLAIAVSVLGLLACCVGLLVALPVITIAEAYTYRRLQGEPVAA
ncbi:hypothetical protein [Nocardioides gilvus]|uniref:hypothetical protein n=1 Tax=Nocardioides gilvus TaxID=1735589 RepID=UPI0013A548B5|nr:hypothetical protein [Nocardioides gilvus]